MNKEQFILSLIENKELDNLLLALDEIAREKYDQGFWPAEDVGYLVKLRIAIVKWLIEANGK